MYREEKRRKSSRNKLVREDLYHFFSQCSWKRKIRKLLIWNSEITLLLISNLKSNLFGLSQPGNEGNKRSISMASMVAAVADKYNKDFPNKNEPMFSILCRPQGVIRTWKANGGREST